MRDRGSLKSSVCFLYEDQSILVHPVIDGSIHHHRVHTFIRGKRNVLKESSDPPSDARSISGSTDHTQQRGDDVQQSADPSAEQVLKHMTQQWQVQFDPRVSARLRYSTYLTP